MTTDSNGYRYAEHIYGLEYHEHRTDQPWTVWAKGRTVKFCNSLAEAERAFTAAAHGGIEMRAPEAWRCAGCKSWGER